MRRRTAPSILSSGRLQAPRTIGATVGERHRRLRQLRGREHRAPAAPQRGLGERDHLDHALIGFARALAEREDAVLVQDQADRAGRGREHPRRLLGEAEAGHDVGHDAHAAVVKLGGARCAVGLVDQAQHRGRVGVIDEALRNEGVQQRLDRRIGRHRVDEVRALRLHHLLVRHGVALEQHAQLGEPHRRQPGGLDHRHVGAGALDAEDVDLAPHQVRHAQLHRGVAAAVQHELRIAAEQPRRVDPQREIARHAARGITCDQRLGLGLHEAALHACSPMTATGMPAFIGRQQVPAPRNFKCRCAAELPPTRSGNAAASASRVAGSTPRSVMRPRTRRAGVTSKA